MYLVKGKTTSTYPVRVGEVPRKNNWINGTVQIVDYALIQYYQDHTDAYTVVGKLSDLTFIVNYANLAAIPTTAIGIFLALDTNKIYTGNGSALTEIGAGASTGTPRTITASDTAILADGGSVITCNSSSAVTVTIPTNDSVAFPVLSVLCCYQSGTGAASFAAVDGTVTLHTPAGVSTTSVQYGFIFATRVASNEWTLS